MALLDDTLSPGITLPSPWYELGGANATACERPPPWPCQRDPAAPVLMRCRGPDGVFAEGRSCLRLQQRQGMG